MPRPALDQLRERLSWLEGRQQRFSRTVSIGGEVDRHLPFGGLSKGCIHEVKGNLPSALAFAAILSARIAQSDGHILYIAPSRSLHPLGLLPYGIRLEQLLVVSVKQPQERSWAVLEALRCPQVSAVLTFLEGVDLTDSRRLQLAAESSGATGFLLGRAGADPIAAPVSRWMIRPQIRTQGRRFDEPAWKLDLLYCRGGQPGNWMLEWRNQELTAFSRQIPAAKSTPAVLAG